MSKIEDLPLLERPREKALRFGINTLSDAELIAIIIGSGYKGVSALDVANDLLSRYHGLFSLYNTDFHIYKRVKGVKNKKGLSLEACFELHRRLNKLETDKDDNNQKIDDGYLFNRYKTQLLKSDQEQLILIIVNRLNRIIYECTLYKGTKNNLIFSYADIWKELTVHKGYGFYLLHNHPLESCKPSKADSLFTKEIARASQRQGFHFHDHIIIGEDGYYSFKKEKIFNFSC